TYADWLEDAGRPERAELVRAQLEQARDRERALLDAHGQRWIEEEVGPGWLLRHSADWVSQRERVLERLPRPRLAAFRRGLVEALFLGLHEFLAAGQDLLTPLPTIRPPQPPGAATGPKPTRHPGRLVLLVRPAIRGGARIPPAGVALPVPAAQPDQRLVDRCLSVRRRGTGRPVAGLHPSRPDSHSPASL